jgi:hypothetical protein
MINIRKHFIKKLFNEKNIRCSYLIRMAISPTGENPHTAAVLLRKKAVVYFYGCRINFLHFILFLDFFIRQVRLL